METLRLPPSPAKDSGETVHHLIHGPPEFDAFSARQHRFFPVDLQYGIDLLEMFLHLKNNIGS